MNFHAFIALVADIAEWSSAGLTAETELEDIGWDSLALLSLIGEIDKMTGIQINMERVHEAKTIADLLGCVSEETG